MASGNYHVSLGSIVDSSFTINGQGITVANGQGITVDSDDFDDDFDDD